MSINKIALAMLLSTAFALPLIAAAAAGEWHFKVTNKTSSKITKLQVSEDKSGWGDFDIGSGLSPGKTMTLVWDTSTDSQECEQWIRAKFSDGTFSEASKQDFCEDLDDPIEFSE